MAIKVLFIGNYDIAPHIARPEAEMIVGLKSRGLDVEVMTRRDCFYGRRMESVGIRVHDYVPPRRLSWRAVRTIRRVLREGRHDVLHLFNNKAIANGVWAALGLPVRVVTYRGHPDHISRYDPSCYLTQLHPRVDRIVCVSDTVRNELLKQVRDPAIPITIYKGHDVAWYAGVAPLNRAELGVPPDAFLIGCVANSRPRKGVPVLLAAAGLLPPELPVYFALAGSGLDEASLRPLLEGNPAAARIRALGHRNDALSLVAACDATVLPATKPEGLPRSVIESMSLGVVPVVTRSGGSHELLVDGQCGFVVEPGSPEALADAIVRLVSDRAAARAMGAAARERIATHFRVEDSVEGHLRLYEQLCRQAVGT